MPNVTTGSLLDLLDRRAGTVDAVCFSDPTGAVHPLPGVYARRLLERLGDDAPPSLRGVLETARVRLVPVDDDRLLNVNRPEDLGA
jgi:molybdopterin-guanine dinucleotide biosynthesis protein A